LNNEAFGRVQRRGRETRAEREVGFNDGPGAAARAKREDQTAAVHDGESIFHCDSGSF
jgi:hypothetical protein